MSAASGRGTPAPELRRDVAAWGEHPWRYTAAKDAGLFRGWGVRAVDGDTVDVYVDAGFRLRAEVRVRLRDVDTPEIYGVSSESEEYRRGKAAQRRVAELVEGRPVLLDTRGRAGKYGRWLAEVLVWNGEELVGLGAILKREGLAE